MSDTSYGTPVTTSPEPPRSFWSRWVGVYLSPGATFEDVARRPEFIYPLVTAIVSAFVLTETMLGKIGMERIIRNAIEQSGRAGAMSAEQMDQAVQGGATFGLVMSHLGAALGPPIFLLIVAALGLAIVNGIFGGEINFKQSFSVACYANLVGVLAVVMALPMILLGDPERFNPNNPAPTNIGFFLNPLETSKTVMAVAGSVDIFSLWMIALLGIGYSAATGRRVKAFSVGAIYFGLWLVVVVGKITLAVIF